MTVRITKPEFNLREKISELDKPTGLKGHELMRSDSSQDARDLISAGRKNLIINGDMQIAQRGTSSTTSGDYTADRFKVNFSGLDENLTFAQVDVASGTTPYTLGFRKSLKLTNGNQTSGAESADFIKINYIIEAQDIATSGWDYKSGASFITLSFWVKSSVAQNFFSRLTTNDGTAQSYVFETGSITADNWTKITKTVPGNSNLTFNNDTGNGLLFEFIPFRGTNTTGTRPLNVWATFDGASRCPDMTSSWYTTDDATLEITGVQLEVGRNATEFEHRSYGEELNLCQRYFFKNINESGENGCNYGKAFNSNEMFASIRFPTPMRATPTIIAFSNSGTAQQVHKLGNPDTGYSSIDRLDVYGGMRFNSSGAWATGDTDMYSFTFEANAEL